MLQLHAALHLVAPVTLLILSRSPHPLSLSPFLYAHLSGGETTPPSEGGGEEAGAATGMGVLRGAAGVLTAGMSTALLCSMSRWRCGMLAPGSPGMLALLACCICICATPQN